MLLVQQALRQQRIADAVGLYRTARTLWPLEGVFGTNDIVPEDEFLELHAIYFADLKEVISVLSYIFTNLCNAKRLLGLTKTLSQILVTR